MEPTLRVRFVGGPNHNQHLVVRLVPALRFPRPTNPQDTLVSPLKAAFTVHTYGFEWVQYELRQLRTEFGTPFLAYHHVPR